MRLRSLLVLAALPFALACSSSSSSPDTAGPGDAKDAASAPDSALEGDGGSDAAVPIQSTPDAGTWDGLAAPTNSALCTPSIPFINAGCDVDAGTCLYGDGDQIIECACQSYQWTCYENP